MYNYVFKVSPSADKYNPKNPKTSQNFDTPV